ncbi:hypothetical protein SD70_09790 [Gordoniibacillus kamchatkensis]|uniref:DUF4025 domain-containing protein n=1 Tax=Gordoniibacillus kamchatkensis TaxID=1590651 RepID=A0ABR5AJR5_9BACL|nr:hypothetical protein [Paenibacillus sp. VKM B-2647]KIL41078.1 hypothetical protein SD70_09790 [Paenibacillus sp. VKM B-2647]
MDDVRSNAQPGAADTAERDVTKAASADSISAATDEKLDDIYTYSSVGINDVKEDATGENVRADIGGISAGDMQAQRKERKGGK